MHLQVERQQEDAVRARRPLFSYPLTLALVLLLCARAAAADLPVIFVHGAGDSSALWHTQIWRFESNGYDPAMLFAIDFTHPAPRRDDTVPEENRSSTVDQASELSALVTRVLLTTGSDKVVLVGSSRGGNAIRNYVKRAGGAVNVAKAILCGTPNHGVTAHSDSPNAEFNGMGRFLTALNAGAEVHPDVAFMTLRSDANDKYAQPQINGRPSGVTVTSPELAGALNVMLPGLDHREVAFHPLAFREMYRFITGSEPKTLDIVPEARPVLNGRVTGYASLSPTNLPVAGAVVTVFEVDPDTGQRKGPAVHSRATRSDGAWGPFTASPTAYYEIVLSAPASPTFHFYRTPFPRSSGVVHLRLRPEDPADAGSGSVVVLSRPRGYLGHGRDTFLVDDVTPGGVVRGVPTSDSAMTRFPPGPVRPVRVVLNNEALTVLTHPFTAGHIVIAEFQY